MKLLCWKQENPVDQLTVIRAAMEGHLDNWRERIIDDLTLKVRLSSYLYQISVLEPFLKGQEKW